jgi:flagellar hook-basal body complex protein FliE
MRIGSLPVPQPHELQQLFDAARTAKTQEPSAGAPAQTAPQKAQFASFLDHAVAEVDAKLKAAGDEQMKVFTGETNNLHQAMIAVQEASVAFSLMVEVRNKLVEGYQEIMRMQV